MAPTLGHLCSTAEHSLITSHSQSNAVAPATGPNVWPRGWTCGAIRPGELGLPYLSLKEKYRCCNIGLELHTNVKLVDGPPHLS
jgi:hypothetical protein